MIRKLFALFALLGLLTVGGCANTVAGAGEDISNMGRAITKSAE